MLIAEFMIMMTMMTIIMTRRKSCFGIIAIHRIIEVSVSSAGDTENPELQHIGGNMSVVVSG